MIRWKSGAFHSEAEPDGWDNEDSVMPEHRAAPTGRDPTGMALVQTAMRAVKVVAER